MKKLFLSLVCLFGLSLSLHAESYDYIKLSDELYTQIINNVRHNCEIYGSTGYISTYLGTGTLSYDTYVSTMGLPNMMKGVIDTCLIRRGTDYITGNLGIGIANPLSKLHIKSDVNSYGMFRIEHSSLKGESSIGFRDSVDSDSMTWVIGKNIATTADSFMFFRGSGGPGFKLTIKTDGNVGIGTTNPTAKLEVNGSALFTGIVTKSNQPCCRTYMASNQTGLVSEYTKLNFDTEFYDVNSNYDTTNKRFVAPVSGYYQVNLIVDWVPHQTSKERIIAIYVNGNVYIQVRFTTTLADVPYSQSVSDLIYCTIGQYIEAYYYTAADDTNDLIYGSSEGGTYFSITLLN